MHVIGPSQNQREAKLSKYAWGSAGVKTNGCIIHVTAVLEIFIIIIMGQTVLLEYLLFILILPVQGILADARLNRTILIC